MKREKLLTLAGSVCLILILAALPFMGACAAPPEEVTPPPPPEEEKPTPPPPPTPPEEEWPTAITFASAGEGTSQFVTHAGMASIISRELGIKTVPEASHVGLKTLTLLHNKDVELASSTDHAAYEAARGLGEFPQLDFRLLWNGASFNFAVLSLVESELRSMDDLRGKKVAATHPANLTFTRAGDFFLRAAGMTDDDIVRVEAFGSKDFEPALRERRIAACVCGMGLMGIPGWVDRLNIELDAHAFGLPPENIAAVLSEYPYFFESVLAKDVYGDLVVGDVPTIATGQSAYCRTDLPDDFVYAIMNAVFDHADEVATFHADAFLWTDNPIRAPVAPFHPGAIKYYKERGLWTVELDSIQEQLLAETVR